MSIIDRGSRGNIQSVLGLPGGTSGSATSTGASGAVQFSNGTGGFSADATNFFWNDTTNRLGIGTNSPTSELDVRGTIIGRKDNASSFRVKGPQAVSEGGADVQSYAGIFYNDAYVNTGTLKTRVIFGANVEMDFELQSPHQLRLVAVDDTQPDGKLYAASKTNFVINLRADAETASPKQLIFDRVTTGSTGLANTSDVVIKTSSGSLYLNHGITSGALVFPSLTTAQRNALTPAAGWILFNTTDATFQGYDGTQWEDIPGSSSGGGVALAGAARARSDGNIDLTNLPATIDSETLNNGDFFLAADQGVASENGVYEYTGVGNAATRATGWDTAEAFTAGRLVTVTEGTIFHNTMLAVQATITTLDVDNILIEVVGFDYSSVPVELKPYVNNQVQNGTDGRRWTRGWFTDFVNLGTAGGGDNIELGFSETAPSGAAGAGIKAPTTKDLVYFTRTNDDNDAAATKSQYFETGNKDDGTGDSGSFFVKSGNSAGGVRGDFSLDVRSLLVTATITAGGTTGNQTINKMSGTVNFATAATSLTVTNDTVTTDSIVLAIVATNDATMKSVQAVPGSGSFVLYANAAAAAETSVRWFVFNN